MAPITFLKHRASKEDRFPVHCCTAVPIVFASCQLLHLTWADTPLREQHAPIHRALLYTDYPHATPKPKSSPCTPAAEVPH